MSVQGVPIDLQDAVFPASGTALYVSGVGHLIAWGSSVPADATAGYGKSCIFHNTAGTGTSDTLYVNIGTLASCNFDAVGSLS